VLICRAFSRQLLRIQLLQSALGCDLVSLCACARYCFRRDGMVVVGYSEGYSVVLVHFGLVCLEGEGLRILGNVSFVFMGCMKAWISLCTK
jgi:hypothetical protein